MIGKTNIQRWYDLVPETLDAHAPRRAQMPRSHYAGEPEKNLAAQAEVIVDSYYGTTNLADPKEVYPVLNQVHVSWELDNTVLRLHLSTNTPHFSHFSWRFDRGLSQNGNQTALSWFLHTGENQFDVCAVNDIGRSGRMTTLVATVKESAEGSLPVIVVDCENGADEGTVQTFLWEDFNHPVLQRVRTKYGLESIIAPGNSDLEKLVLLRDWVKSRWDHDQPIYSPPWNAEYLFDHTDKKIEAFYCVHYSIAFMQCCLALGIPARLINLHRGICTTPVSERGYGRELTSENPCDEHVVNEVWVDDLGKWVMLDVDFDIHYELAGHPLSAVEIHNALLNNQLSELIVHEGPLAWKLKSSPDFFQSVLPTYYRHVCVFWRNNHLDDPEGPDPILHWVDDNTPAMLWWEGTDLRHRPQIIGPVGVSFPYSSTTPILTDGNMATCWASADTPVEHFVELSWDTPQAISKAEILWAGCWGRYFNSRQVEIEAWINNGWQWVASVHNTSERALDEVSINEMTTKKLRLRQPRGCGSAEFPNRMWISEIGIS